jgi:hypothetical protein
MCDGEIHIDPQLFSTYGKNLKKRMFNNVFYVVDNSDIPR